MKCNQGKYHRGWFTSHARCSKTRNAKHEGGMYSVIKLNPSPLIMHVTPGGTSRTGRTATSPSHSCTHAFKADGAEVHTCTFRLTLHVYPVFTPSADKADAAEGPPTARLFHFWPPPSSWKSRICTWPVVEEWEPLLTKGTSQTAEPIISISSRQDLES